MSSAAACESGAAAVVVAEPGPDPSRSEPALTAVVHEAFLHFLLHMQPERVLRLPPHLFTGVVTYLIHWRFLGLYGLPPPDVSEEVLLDNLSALVHRYMVRQRALHNQPEPATGPAASGALGRELLEAALRASKASLLPEDEKEEREAQMKLLHKGAARFCSHDDDGSGTGSDSDDSEATDPDEAPAASASARAASATSAAGSATCPAGSMGTDSPERKRRPPHVSELLLACPGANNLIDRLAEHETARKLVFDLLEPADLAAAQTVCHRWRRMALPRAAEYFWNVLVCSCWWATFPSVDSKHGCCMLEFLRREATFSESVKHKAIALPPGSAPRLPLPVLPAAGSLPRGADPLAPVYAYLSNFVIAIDVADRLIDSLLASATIDLGDEEARTAFLHPVALRERSPQLVPKNTGFLRGWEFKDGASLERYLNSGHEAYRLEVMIIHKKSGRVAMMLPSEETQWPAVGPGGMRYGIQWVQDGLRELGIGTFGTVPAGQHLSLSFEMLVRVREAEASEGEAAGPMEGPRLSMSIDTVAMHLVPPTTPHPPHAPEQPQDEAEEDEDEEEEDDVVDQGEDEERHVAQQTQLLTAFAQVLPYLMWR